MHVALAHRSWCAENPGASSNERLEFLGDAVLGLVVTARLFLDHPDKSEGDLARIRAAVVSTRGLAPVARSLGVGEALLLGRGEASSGGSEKPSLLADALEAIIGATYLSGGADAAEALVLLLLGPSLDDEARRRELGDAKNRLQELAARRSLPAPTYVTEGRGPDHARRFHAVVSVGGLSVEGDGRTKKDAERLAAEEAIVALDATVA